MIVTFDAGLRELTKRSPNRSKAFEHFDQARRRTLVIERSCAAAEAAKVFAIRFGCFRAAHDASLAPPTGYFSETRAR
jgi:hypothetical protein